MPTLKKISIPIPPRKRIGLIVHDSQKSELLEWAEYNNNVLRFRLHTKGENTMNPFDFHLPTKIIFGRGRIAELGAQVPAKTKRVFIVTDETIATRTPALDVTLQALSGRKIRTFTRVEENPSIATVEDGGREARTFKAQLVIGLGGGSPMDAAKGIAMLAANPGPLSRHLGGEPMKRPPSGRRRSGDDNARNPGSGQLQGDHDMRNVLFLERSIERRWIASDRVIRFFSQRLEPYLVDRLHFLGLRCGFEIRS